MRNRRVGHSEGRPGATAQGRRKLVLRLSAMAMILLTLGMFMGGVIAYLTDEQALVNTVTITENFPTPTPTVSPSPSPTPTMPLESFIFKVEWIGLAEDEAPPTFTTRLYRNVVKNDKNVTEVSKHVFILDGEGFYHAWRMRPGDYWLQSNPLNGFIPLYRNAEPNTLVSDKLYSGGTLVFYKVPQTGDSRVPKGLLWASAVLCAVGLALLLAGGRRETTGWRMQ